MTPHGLYCYKVISFKLKHASATYQRLMIKIFKPLIGRTVEVCINDIFVKNITRDEHTQHLGKRFCLMRTYNMKLNTDKCAFGVRAGKFLGFMVTQSGIEVNPNQIRAVLETLALSSKKNKNYSTSRVIWPR